MLECGIRLTVILSSVRDSITEKQNLSTKWKEVRQRAVCRSLGKEHSRSKDKQMKGPGIGEYLACGRRSKDAMMAAAQ